MSGKSPSVKVGTRPGSTEGEELQVWERRVSPAQQLGARGVVKGVGVRACWPLGSSPVMLSTSTCHLCSSCSSVESPGFWRSLSHGQLWGEVGCKV